MPKDFTWRSIGLPGALQYQATLPEVYWITTKKPTDIIPKQPTEMATEKSTKNAPKPKNDSLQMKPNRITYPITDISITIPNHEKSPEVHKSTEPRWQLTIDIYRSRHRATNFQKEWDRCVRSVKSYWQVKSPPGGSLPRHAPTSLPRNQPRSLLGVDQDSTKAAYRECTYEVNRMVTEVDFARRVNAQYRWLLAAGYILQSMR